MQVAVVVAKPTTPVQAVVPAELPFMAEMVAPAFQQAAGFRRAIIPAVVVVQASGTA